LFLIVNVNPSRVTFDWSPRAPLTLPRARVDITVAGIFPKKSHHRLQAEQFDNIPSSSRQHVHLAFHKCIAQCGVDRIHHRLGTSDFHTLLLGSDRERDIDGHRSSDEEFQSVFRHRLEAACAYP
jgi:hypothetical protein